MDTKQPNALRLADALGRAPKWQQLQAAAELRRQHAEIETLRKTNTAARGTDAQIIKERELCAYAFAGAVADGLSGGTGPDTQESEWLRPAFEAGQEIAQLRAEIDQLRKRECLHQICETAAPASDGEYPKLPERAAFEDWIKKDGGDLRMFGSGQNTHYCNSAVNNAWGGWKASAARVATTASAPVVLPEPDVFAKVSHKGAAKWDVEFTWPVGKFEEDGDHKLYTEQQVRALLAAAPKPPAHEPGQHGSAYPAHGITAAPNGGDHGR